MQPAGYKHYLLGLLTVISLFNYVDRMALGIALQDIKVDLDLTDTELGFLTGIAFALFYSVMGVPIARWADRGHRGFIISLTALLWSGMVALCGMAANFVQLLLIRVGVAVGEAGCVPPAMSLIADYYDRAQRPRAAAIYGLGGALSFVVGFLLAGWLNELYGWRVMFVLLGAPGLVLSVLAYFTVREPRRMTAVQRTAFLTSPDLRAQTSVQPNLKEVASTLLGNVTFRHLLLCLSVLYLFGYGILQWQPTFLVRSYGLTSSETGMWLAVSYGSGSIIGAFLGGELATRYAANNERLQLRAMALAIGVSGVLATFVYTTANQYVAFGFLTLYILGLYTLTGPLFATIQTLVPERMRAVAIALVYLVANLIGMGLGPLIAGMLSDAYRPWAAEESLRYALLSLCPGYLWGAWHAWRASKTVQCDLVAAQLQRLVSTADPG